MVSSQDLLDDQTMKREEELAEEAEKATEPVPEKSWEDSSLKFAKTEGLATPRHKPTETASGIAASLLTGLFF